MTWRDAVVVFLVAFIGSWVAGLLAAMLQP